MKWIKQGLIYFISKPIGWMYSHTSVPFIDKLIDDVYRIYFSSRDKHNRSHTTFIDVNINNPKKILNHSKNPILSPGEVGAFDDSGAMGCCMVNVTNKKYLYYIGWNKGVTVPYRNSIGLAVSNDNGVHFKRFSGPIIDRNILEPHFSASNFVLVENNIWRMWYLSCLKWELKGAKPRPKYHIKYAESNDGVHWRRNGTVCIDFKNSDEWAISRPCVIKKNGVYKMWYSYCGKLSYRIGYAESVDGISWIRKDDEVGIDVSEEGWDSKSIEYPFVFEHGNTIYMLYCGNDFGKSGFGYAIMEGS